MKKPNTKSNRLLGTKARRDKRVRHGLYSNAVKKYKRLDREFRNCSEPTAEMIHELESSILHAFNAIFDATDTNDPDAIDRSVKFILDNCLPTHQMVVQEVKENFVIVGVRGE